MKTIHCTFLSRLIYYYSNIVESLCYNFIPCIVDFGFNIFVEKVQKEPQSNGVNTH